MRGGNVLSDVPRGRDKLLLPRAHGKALFTNFRAILFPIVLYAFVAKSVYTHALECAINVVQSL